MQLQRLLLLSMSAVAQTNFEQRLRINTYYCVVSLRTWSLSIQNHHVKLALTTADMQMSIRLCSWMLMSGDVTCDDLREGEQNCLNCFAAHFGVLSFCLSLPRLDSEKRYSFLPTKDNSRVRIWERMANKEGEWLQWTELVSLFERSRRERNINDCRTVQQLADTTS